MIRSNGKRWGVLTTLARLEAIVMAAPVKLGLVQPKRDIEIRLLRRANNTYYWEVNVRSKKIVRLKAKGIWEWARHDQSKDLGILAAAMAEELAEKYKDARLDPDYVYNETVRIYREMRARNIKLYGAGDEAPRAADKLILGK